jgi:RNA polymerase sigma factor (sigma-70 family)
MGEIQPLRSWLLGISELKKSYRSTYRMLIHAKERACGIEDKELITEMISDVSFAIEWMQTGKCPGNRRGIERRASYQREKLTDPFQMQIYVEQSIAETAHTLLTEEQKARIEHVLSALSTRERECYELHHGMRYSLSEIAALLGLKKGTIQSYLQTAHKKIMEHR